MMNVPGRVVYNPSFHKKQPDLRFFLVGLSYICRPHIYLNGRLGSCLRSNKIKHLFGFLISNKNMKMQTWADSATGPKQELENCTKIIHLNNHKYSEIKQRERFYNNKSLAKSRIF